MRKAQVAKTTIGSLAPGGNAVAHVEIDGERRAVFVPHGAPGDVVLARIDASHRPARGSLVELLSPGPDRVEPVCPHSRRCGGCDWMHLSIRAQERTHVEHVVSALPASWQKLPVRTHEAPQPVGYRTRARVHVRCERGRVTVGMNEASTHDPVNVDTCAVLVAALEEARRALAAMFEGSRGSGDVQMALGAGTTRPRLGQGVIETWRPAVLDVRWSGELAPAFFGRVDTAVSAGRLAGARVTLSGASRPAVIGDPTPWIQGADGAPLRLAPGGFAQASEQTSATLARHVAELVRPWRPEAAVELYAGAGTLSVLLARETGRLTLVEVDGDACNAARANLAARGLEARIVQANAEGFAWGGATDLVVLDPPRTGARAVAARLAGSRVGHVVYVSCDPQTLGRDLKELAPAYEARDIATFEMFPHTSHVETVVALERRR